MSPSNHTIVLKTPQELFVRSRGDGFVELPGIPVPPGSRIACELTDYLRREWQIDAISLFTPHFDDPSEQWNVLSMVRRQRVPKGHTWLATSEAVRRLASPRQAERLRISLEQAAAYDCGEKSGRFARAGWLNELRSWAEPALAAHGLHWNGRFRQFGCGPESALMRLETDGRAVWFKAVSEPMAREYAITKYLAEHTPGAVPELLASSDRWRAWMALEVEGRKLGECQSLDAWLGAAQKLAAVQRASVRSVAKLLSLGAIDYRSATVLNNLDHLLRKLPDIMSRQPADSRAPRLSRDEMDVLRYRIPVLAEAFFESSIPMTLVHGDPNGENFIVGDGGTTMLDWAESYVSHPFLSYEYLRMHLHRTQPIEAPEWEKALEDVYARGWRPTVEHRDIQDAFALVPLVAPLLVASRTLDRLEERVEDAPKMEAQIRSLARVAFRALQPVLVEAASA